MLFQGFAFLLYVAFSCVVLLLWPSYKLSIKNIVVFVTAGAIGIMTAALVSSFLAGTQGVVESRAILTAILGSLAIGLLGGSYIGLKYFGTKSDGK